MYITYITYNVYMGKLYNKHVLYVNFDWIIIGYGWGCIKDQSPLSFTHIGECFNELWDTLYSCNYCQMGKHCSYWLLCKDEKYMYCMYLVNTSMNYKIFSTHATQPDARTLFLLAVVCHDEIKIHVFILMNTSMN